MTWKDGVTTILAAATVVLVIAAVKRWDWPLIHNWRLVILGVGVLGLATCIFSGVDINAIPATYRIVMSVLGGLSMVLILLGLIIGSEFIAISLAAVTLLMWVVSTARHIFGA